MPGPVADPPTFPTRNAPSLRVLLAPARTAGRLRQVAVVAGLQVLGSYALAGTQDLRERPDALALVLLLAGPLFLLARQPVLLPAIGTCLATVVYVSAGYPLGPVFLAPALGLTIAVLGGRLLPVAAVALGSLVLATIGSWIGPHALSLSVLAALLGWIAAVLTAAAALRLHREREQARAARRDEVRSHRATEERLRIASALHQSLSQQVSVMSTKARLARHVLETAGMRRSDEIAAALEDISRSGVDVLAELRSVSGVLEARGTAGPNHPAPGLSGLPELVRACGEAGLRVELYGRSPRLYRAIDQAAYRVAKAALEEVAEYSAAVSARVILDVMDVAGTGSLVVRVVDDGPENSSADGGQEAVGGPPARGARLDAVRHRVEALGGTLTGGPTGEVGWTVRAVLPLQPARIPA